MRILIADDSALLREGLRLLLEDAGHDVVGAAANGTELIALALELRPDLVIADIRMPPSHTDEGLRAAQKIRDEWSDAPIMLLSQYVVVSYATELIESGTSATGIFSKTGFSIFERSSNRWTALLRAVSRSTPMLLRR